MVIIDNPQDTPLFGDDLPCLIIAEAGVNHNGNLDLAYKLVDAAAEAKADAVKFQTFLTDKLVITSAKKAEYQRYNRNDEESQSDMLRRLELGFASFEKLSQYCKQKNILFLSTPFDEVSADFLDSIGIRAFKIGSGEITNTPFLASLARKGKPMIVSTGMSGLAEIEIAVQTIRETGNPSLALLHCTSNYPVQPVNVNLRAMHTLKTAFGVPVGYSDHSLGFEISLAAVALGAKILEKHITLDRELPGPDHRASLEPSELSSLVQGIRKIEASLGDGRKLPTSSELEMAAIARKSLVTSCNLEAGHILTAEDITVKRPGTGLSPGLLPFIIGRRLCMDVSADTLLSLDMLI